MQLQQNIYNAIRLLIVKRWQEFLQQVKFQLEVIKAAVFLVLWIDHVEECLDAIKSIVAKDLKIVETQSNRMVDLVGCDSLAEHFDNKTAANLFIDVFK